MKLQRRAEESISIAFLDVITCGIGAIILLLMISKPPPAVAPAPVDDPRVAEIARLQRTLFSLEDEQQKVSDELAASTPRLTALKDETQRLRDALLASQFRARGAAQAAARDAEELGKLKIAQQTLSEEMRRLRAERQQRVKAALVGGIPIDSEYVIFIIDTSASMGEHVTDALKRQMREILTVYPRLKGLQILSDGGDYLVPGSARGWLQDSPNLREELIETIPAWRANSPSNPQNGIYTAIRDYYSSDRKISLYILGDEFANGSIDEVVKYVDSINPRDAQGNPRIRIHGIGFPTRTGQFKDAGAHFAAFMRRLTHRNGGTFVGLNAYR